MKCPHCQSELEGSGFFEFFQCPHCQASLHEEAGEVQLLQKPHVQDEASMEEPKSSIPQNDLENEPVEEQQPFTEEESLESSEEASHIQLEESQNPTTHLQDEGEELVFGEEEPALADAQTDEPENTLLEFQSTAPQQNVNDLSNSPSPSMDSSAPSLDVDDLSSLEDFGSAPIQKGQSMYELEISGIHSTDISKKLKSLLSQSILNLEASKLLSQVRDGQLKISQLNPIQAIYIIKHLSGLPVSLSWTQKSYLLDE